MISEWNSRLEEENNSRKPGKKEFVKVKMLIKSKMGFTIPTNEGPIRKSRI